MIVKWLFMPCVQPERAKNLVTGKKTNEWQEKAIGRRISNESAEA
jgi:hypothetical protein